MTGKQIGVELIKIAKMSANGTEPFISCDMVGQDELFEIQEKLMDLIDKIVHKEAVKALPYMYRVEKAEKE